MSTVDRVDAEERVMHSPLHGRAADETESAAPPASRRTGAIAVTPEAWRVGGVSLAVSAGALVLGFWLARITGPQLGFALAYPATALAAHIGGSRASLTVTVVLAMLTPWVVDLPSTAGSFALLGLFVAFGGLTAWLSAARRPAAARVDDGAARLAAALANANAALVEFDAQLRCTWAAGEWHGRAADQLVGKTPPEILGGRDGERFAENARKVLKSGEPLRVGTTLGSGGERRHYEQTMTPLHGDGARVVGVRVAQNDRTERRVEQERQRDADELLRVAVEQSHDAYEVLRPVRQEGRTVDFVWEHVNPAAAALMERDASALVGSRVVGSGGDAFQCRRRAHWIEVIDRGVPGQSQVTREGAHGETTLDMRSFSLGDRLVAVTRLPAGASAADVSRERQNKSRDALLSNLSHELRTPLNAILGWTHVLGRDEADSSMTQRAAEAIERNARAQAVLVDDLLDLGRIANGTLRLNSAPCDVAATVLHMVDQVQPAAQAKWIGVDVQQSDGGLMCMGDTARLEQAFRHLLGNAVKHTPLNGSVYVSIEQDDGRARVEIRDTGEGIAADVLPQLFERFQQADASMSRPHGGLGIGLSIVRSLIELHGGTIAVESEGAGKGATVRVELPLIDAARPSAESRVRTMQAVAPAASDEPPAGTESAAATASTHGPLAWRRILLLEDEADSLELMSVLLREQGAIVRAFDNAEHALAAVENGSFDLIVSDLGMPGMNGLDFMRRVHQHSPAVQAIALTAYSGSAQREMALEAGFKRVEVKPISAPRFLDMVIRELGHPASA
jgi:signal transduction histidine kinase